MTELEFMERIFRTMGELKAEIVGVNTSLQGLASHVAQWDNRVTRLEDAMTARQLEAAEKRGEKRRIEAERQLGRTVVSNISHPLVWGTCGFIIALASTVGVARLGGLLW